jgi:hypothetical protein
LQHPDLLEFSGIDMEMVELTLGMPLVVSIAFQADVAHLQVG